MIINNLMIHPETKQFSYSSPVFGAKINEQKMLKNLDKETYKSMDAYITNLLKVVTDLNHQEIKDIVSLGIKKAKETDKDTFYLFYSKILRDIMEKRKLIRPNNRENFYADITSMLLNGKNITPNSIYLDVGCGNCSITKVLTDKINIKKGNSYGIDLLETKEFNGIVRQQFDGQKIPAEIPNADLVTIFQVLHHIKTQKEAEKLLNSVYKNMNDGGYLIIREHEVNDTKDRKFWKFIHDLQCKILGTASKDLDNGTLYISSHRWENLLNRVGFKTIRKYYDTSYNDKTSYFMLLQK